MAVYSKCTTANNTVSTAEQMKRNNKIERRYSR